MRRFLIVDDEPAVARVVRSVAQECGYAVTVTTDAETFLDEAVADPPDVISLDLSLPGRDGVELLRFLAAARCDARIIIISGFDERVLETTGRLGAALGLRIAATLYKPVRVADLRNAIQTARASAL